MNYLELLCEIAIMLALVVVHLLLSIVVHEGGHLVLGLATGYRFLSFNVLSFVFVKEEGRLRVRRSKNGLIAGQCLLTPPTDETRFRWFWYNAGGGLFNLAAALLLLPGFLLTRGGALAANGFFMLGVVTNATMGLMNLIPMSMGIPNDGLNILTAWKSPLARRALYLMLKVNADTQAGGRYRDYSAQAFATGGPVNPRNYLEVYMLMLQAARLDDLDRRDEAIQAYSGLALEQVNSYYASSIRLDYLYYYCVYSVEHDKAREIYSDSRVKKLLQNPLPTTLRIMAAVQYFILGQQAAARETMEKARAQLEAYPNAGIRAMETDYLEELAEAMDAAEQNSLDGDAGALEPEALPEGGLEDYPEGD